MRDLDRIVYRDRQHPRKDQQGRLIFAPPSGWSYAQETEATQATIQGAAFALTTFAKSDAKSHGERDEAVKMLADKLGLVLPKRHSSYGPMLIKSRRWAISLSCSFRWEARSAKARRALS